MSLPQKPYQNDAEAQRFRLELHSINLWYLAPFLTVVLVTTEPNGSRGCNNTRPYEKSRVVQV